MKKQDLARVLKSVSAKELKGLISVKEKLDTLQKRKTELEKSLAVLDKQIDSLKKSPLKDATKKKPARKKKTVKKKNIAKKPAKKKTQKSPAAKKKTLKKKTTKKPVKKKVKAAPKARKKVVKKATKKTKGKTAQPSISSLIVDILKEKKKPLTVNDICNTLLKEKKYKTKSKKFSNQIRVMLYRNDKGLFKKAGPGAFTLAKTG